MPVARTVWQLVVAGESLVVHRGRVVTPSGKRVTYVAVNVLVELDLHEVSTTGRIRSVASCAP